MKRIPLIIAGFADDFYNFLYEYRAYLLWLALIPYLHLASSVQDS